MRVDSVDIHEAVQPKLARNRETREYQNQVRLLEQRDIQDTGPRLIYFLVHMDASVSSSVLA